MSSEEFARRLTQAFIKIAELLEAHLVYEAVESEETTKDDQEDVSIFESLLRSYAGEKLAEYTVQIQSFVIKGIYLMFPFRDFTKTLRKLYSNPDEHPLVVLPCHRNS